MAWTSPKSWSGSEVLSSSDMNEQCSGNMEYIYDNFALSNQWTLEGTSIAQANIRIESGQGTLTKGNALAYGSETVTFNTAFGTAPRVVMTPDSSAAVYWAAVSAVGTGQFTAFICRSGTASSADVPYNWMAIGA